MDKKIIAIDFDGTIAKYDTFNGHHSFGMPIPGAIFALCELKRMGCIIIINTCRPAVYQVKEYLLSHNIPFDYVNFSPRSLEWNLSPTKVWADVYIDDKNIAFKGDWGATLSDIENFKQWWRK